MLKLFEYCGCATPYKHPFLIVVALFVGWENVSTWQNIPKAGGGVGSYRTNVTIYLVADDALQCDID